MTSRRELSRRARLAIPTLALAAAVSAPGARGAAPAPPAAPDLRTARIVDLTHPFDEKTPYWPTATRGFELARVHYGRTEAGYFYSAYPVHQVVAAANVPGFENLAHLEDLPATGAWIVALPMKIANGSGGPLRAIALLP